jgi:hypothetical protein
MFYCCYGNIKTIANSINLTNLGRQNLLATSINAKQSTSVTFDMEPVYRNSCKTLNTSTVTPGKGT